MLNRGLPVACQYAVGGSRLLQVLFELLCSCDCDLEECTAVVVQQQWFALAHVARPGGLLSLLGLLRTGVVPRTRDDD